MSTASSLRQVMEIGQGSRTDMLSSDVPDAAYREARSLLSSANSLSFYSADETSPDSDIARLVAVYSNGQALVRPPPLTAAQMRRRVSATNNIVEWEGVVEEIEGRSIRVKLHPLKGISHEEIEFSSFDIGDIPEDDWSLVKLGAIFRWVVGFEAKAGTRQKFSRIVFRRLPAWNMRDRRKAEAMVSDIFSGVKWTNNEGADK